MKICIKCKRLLPETEFWNRYATCKNCRKKYINEYYREKTEKKLKINRKYKHSDKGRETCRIYANKRYHTRKGQDYYKKYGQSEKGKLLRLNAVKKYHKTKKGKAVKRKQDAKRRKLGYVPLFDNPFPEGFFVAFHHINNILTIPIPDVTHKKYGQGRNIGRHRTIIKKWIEKIYSINIDIFSDENG